MFKLKSLKNQKISSTIVVQTLFYLFPLTFILGNLVVSLHCVIFILASTYLIYQKKLNFRFNNQSWILVIFFLYFFFLTFVQFQYPGLIWDEIITELKNTYGGKGLLVDWWMSENGNPAIKTLLLFRFLFLFLVIDILFFNKVIDIKKFFLSSFICTSFVSLDILLQYITGSDIFNYKTEWKYNSGPFGDEKIANTYLKNFSFFSFFYLFQLKENKNLKNLSFIFIIIIHLTAVLVAGSRMPMILFLFGCFFIFLMVKNLRFVMSVGVFLFLLISLQIAKTDTHIKNSYYKFFIDINIIKNFNNKSKFLTKEENKNLDKEHHLQKEASIDPVAKDILFLRNSGHYKVMNTAIVMWKEKPLTGFGFKAFRIKCLEILEENNRERGDKAQKLACGNHPHNYYFELLSEAGLIGFFLILLFFLVILKDSFNLLLKNNKRNTLELTLSYPFIIIFLLEVWPLKSTGSFFTSWGATFFWLNIAILCAFINEKRIKN